jgi:hypothetical protein
VADPIELACNMVYVYLAGAWSWLNRATAARERLTFRECAKVLGHAGEHMPSLVREVPPTYTGLERLRLAGPDLERDRRRAAYAAGERERARRALDAWFRAVDDGIPLDIRNNLWAYFTEVAIGYLQLTSHHKGNYGVPNGPCGEVGHPSTPHVCTVGGEPLCACPAMEQPHVRNQFTDCNAHDSETVAERLGYPPIGAWDR